MFIPLISYGIGWYAREKGASAETAAYLGLAAGTAWYTRKWLALPTIKASSWLVMDLAKGLGAGTRAAVGASTALAVTAAVLVPVTAGWAVSAVIAGKKGTEDYEKFLKTTVTDPVEAVYMLDESLDAAYGRFDTWNAETPGLTRAPASNAAGLAVGTTEWEINNPQMRYNPFTGEPNRAYGYGV
jgi:hypothetical protein